MTLPQDEPTEVRKGEDLSKESLDAYLGEHVAGFAGLQECRQFPSGFSNLTYCIGDGERQWVLRRPPFGSKVSSAHDMGREWRVLTFLRAHTSKVPEPIAFCEDHDVLGAPFYVMTRLRGTILRREVPQVLRDRTEAPAQLGNTFLSTLQEIHGIPLGEEPPFGHPEGYAERQVAGWTKRYHGSATSELSTVGPVTQWLADNLPANAPQPTVIHNDYKFDNIVLDSDDLTRALGVLDWEMATTGNPWMDLGTSLSYWVEPGDPALLQALRFGPTHLPGMPSRQELVDRYGEATGHVVEQPVFFYAFGLFKLAVILQQIYYRYHHGHTQDERFAQFGETVRGLLEYTAAIIDKGALAL